MSTAEIEKQGLYAPAAVAQMTGISAHVLRAWERRYDAVRPERTSGGARRYSGRDVRRLRLLRRAVDAGHPIGQVGRLPDGELERRLAFGGSHAETGAVLTLPVERVLEQARRMEMDAMERTLSLQLAALGPRSFVRDLGVPLLRRIGEEWERDELSVAAEHAASATLRSLLGTTVRREGMISGGPTVVFATPAAERHELGTLMAATHALGSGARVIYLGPDLPAAEIAYAARSVAARAVALGICESAPASVRGEIETLRQALPSSVEVWLGGNGAASLGAVGELFFIESLEEIDDHVARIR